MSTFNLSLLMLIVSIVLFTMFFVANNARRKAVNKLDQFKQNNEEQLYLIKGAILNLAMSVHQTNAHFKASDNWSLFDSEIQYFLFNTGEITRVDSVSDRLRMLNTLINFEFTELTEEKQNTVSFEEIKKH